MKREREEFGNDNFRPAAGSNVGNQNNARGETRLSHPFKANFNDHFETSITSLRDIYPFLDELRQLTRPSCPEAFTLYDPYYCTGKVREAWRMSEFGITRVIHENRDFYADVENKTAPPTIVRDPVENVIIEVGEGAANFDVTVTNPPFSDDHIERFLKEFAIPSKKPWAMLVPDYIATKHWFTKLVDDVYTPAPVVGRNVGFDSKVVARGPHGQPLPAGLAMAASIPRMIPLMPIMPFPVEEEVVVAAAVATPAEEETKKEEDVAAVSEEKKEGDEETTADAKADGEEGEEEKKDGDNEEGEEDNSKKISFDDAAETEGDKNKTAATATNNSNNNSNKKKPFIFNDGVKFCQEPFYIVPKVRYEFEHPVHAGRDRSHFKSLWIVSGGKRTTELLKSVKARANDSKVTVASGRVELQRQTAAPGTAGSAALIPNAPRPGRGLGGGQNSYNTHNNSNNNGNFNNNNSQQQRTGGGGGGRGGGGNFNNNNAGGGRRPFSNSNNKFYNRR